MKKITLFYIIFCIFICCIQGYADGNHALNQSYSKSVRGLNFVQASGKAGLRCNLPYAPNGSWPVSLFINSIPQDAIIEKAFVYFVTGYQVAPLSNPSLYFQPPGGSTKTITPQNIGKDIPKCWIEDGNITYRADVTSYITGNGTYTVSSNTDDSATDGFTLLIIYRQDTATFTGNIFINDGLVIDTGHIQSKVNISVPDTALLAKGFTIMSDLQEGSSSSGSDPSFILFDLATTHQYFFQRKFWNFEEGYFGLRKQQAEIRFGLDAGYDDCFAVALAGIYFQMADTQVKISEPFTDSFYCVGDTFELKYEIISKFRPDNVFKVLLSDITGKFNNPLVIGSKNSDTAGKVQCVIPANALPGGNYILRIVSTNPVDSTGNNDKGIRISTYPKPPFMMSNSPVCEGLALTLYDFSTDTPASIAWTGPNGFFMTLKNPDVQDVPLTAHGRYYLLKDNYTCGITDSIDVEIKPRAAKPDLIVSEPVCEGDSIKISAFSTTPNITYNLLTPAFFIQNLPAVDTIIAKATILDSGLYRAVAILDGCLSKIDSADMIVYRVPSLDAKTNSPVCQGDVIEFTAGDTTLGAVYTWDGPASYHIKLKDPQVTNADFSNAGEYIVIANVHFCADTDTVTVIVKQTPPAPVAANNSPFCEGGTLQLTATDSLTNLTYTWTAANGFISASKDTIIDKATPAASGIYTVTVELDGCKAADTTLVTIKPQPPKPEPYSNSPVDSGQRLQLNIATPLPGAAYNWRGPASFSSYLLSPYIDSVTAEAAGIYTVTVDLNGCRDSANTTVFINIPGAEDYYLNFYPNPNDGNFTIKGKFVYNQAIKIDITNILGQSVFSKTLETTDNLLQEHITMPFAANGCYFIRIAANGKTHKIPFIIKH